MSANDRQVGGEHYKTGGGKQHWDVCIILKLPYLLSAASKYLCRIHKKNGLQDLEKSIHYLEKQLENGYWVLYEESVRQSVISDIDLLADAGTLSHQERAVLHLIMTPSNRHDIEWACAVLREMFKFRSIPSEENSRYHGLMKPKTVRPGTPEDGGHHARQAEPSLASDAKAHEAVDRPKPPTTGSGVKPAPQPLPAAPTSLHNGPKSEGMNARANQQVININLPVGSTGEVRQIGDTLFCNWSLKL